MNKEIPVTPINPAHYRQGKYETIEVIEAFRLDFCLGNAVKYISRAGKKDPTKLREDIEKALWYIRRRRDQLSEGVAGEAAFVFLPSISLQLYCKSLALNKHLKNAVFSMINIHIKPMGIVSQVESLESAIKSLNSFLDEEAENSAN